MTFSELMPSLWKFRNILTQLWGSFSANKPGVHTYASINPRPERPEWLRQYWMAYSTEHYTDLQNRLETALHRITPLWLEFNSGDELYLSVDRQFDGPREPFTILDTIDIPRGEYWWNQYRLGAEFATRRKLSGDIPPPWVTFTRVIVGDSGRESTITPGSD